MLPERQPLVDLRSPGPPPGLVLDEQVPGGRRIDVDHRLAVGHGQDDRDRMSRPDGDRGRPSRFDAERGRAVQRDRERPPLTHEPLAPVLCSGPAVPCAQAGIELHHRVDRGPLGRQPSHNQCRGQQATADLGHHRLGEAEPAAAHRPGGLEGGAVPPVPPFDDSGRPGRADPERPGVGAPDQSAEQGIAVESGYAEPVHRAVTPDQGGGPGVAQQTVVADRWHPGHLACRSSPRQTP